MPVDWVKQEPNLINVLKMQMPIFIFALFYVAILVMIDFKIG